MLGSSRTNNVTLGVRPSFNSPQIIKKSKPVIIKGTFGNLKLNCFFILNSGRSWKAWHCGFHSWLRLHLAGTYVSLVWTYWELFVVHNGAIRMSLHLALYSQAPSALNETYTRNASYIFPKWNLCAMKIPISLALIWQHDFSSAMITRYSPFLSSNTRIVGGYIALLCWNVLNVQECSTSKCSNLFCAVISAEKYSSRSV